MSLWFYTTFDWKHTVLAGVFFRKSRRHLCLVKERTQRKTGSASHRCFWKKHILWTSQQPPASPQKQHFWPPTFHCFCTIIFPLLTYMGVWLVIWWSKAKTQTNPAKKDFCSFGSFANPAHHEVTREQSQQRKASSCNFLALKVQTIG